MTVTNAAAQTDPSWWSQAAGPSGEADPTAADTGGTDDSFGFADFLDVINPLQHIPVVSTIYRELTGDQISDTARMAGGAIWGGPAGLIGALANTITERETGSDIGATALAYARGEDISPTVGDPATALAAASQATPDLTDSAPELAPPSAAVAQFAASEPALSAGPSAPATGQAQEFSGRAASRLDAFIQQANAVRTPAQAPIAARTAPQQVAAGNAPVAHQPTRIIPQHTASAKVENAAPAPLKLASDGNTDVAHWMMKALDRYESMKTREQS